MPDITGQSIGRYDIIEPLGEGGMGEVYRGYDTRLECAVAVKFIRTEQKTPEVVERMLKRFEREAKAVAALSHPNIVKVTDYGEYEGSPYLVMPLIPGGTLRKYTGQAMAYGEAARLLEPVAKALRYAHEHHVVHRDVKPSNILMTESGEPMLTDFGIAKIMDVGEGQTLTAAGVGVGTPEYMAPEQGMGKEIDGRADIYALGVVYYELITGHPPYTADTPVAVLIKSANDPLPRPTEVVPGLPKRVEEVLYKALAKDPKDRYQGMGEFEKVLEEMGEAVEGDGGRQGEGRRRKWVLWGAIGGVVIVVMAERVSYWWEVGDTDDGSTYGYGYTDTHGDAGGNGDEHTGTYWNAGTDEHGDADEHADGGREREDCVCIRGRGRRGDLCDERGRESPDAVDGEQQTRLRSSMVTGWKDDCLFD